MSELYGLQDWIHTKVSDLIERHLRGSSPEVLYERTYRPLLEAARWAQPRRKLFDVHVAMASPIARHPANRVRELLPWGVATVHSALAA